MILMRGVKRSHNFCCICKYNRHQLAQRLMTLESSVRQHSVSIILGYVKGASNTFNVSWTLLERQAAGPVTFLLFAPVPY